MGIRTYPRSLRNGRTNDGGGQKYVVKDEFLAQKNSSNGTVSGGKNEPKYPHCVPHCVPQCIQEMGHFAGYLWAYWGRAHSDAPIRVGNTHGLADRSLVSTTGHHPTPSATHPPVSSPPVLLSSGLGALGLGRLGWPCHLGCPVLPLPAPLCSSWWRGGCVYLGASEGLRGAVCAQRGRKPGSMRGPNRPFALRQPHSRSEAFYPYYGVNPPEHPREALRRALWRRFWALWPTGTPSRPPRPVPCPRRR